jgi:CRISPR system Cascade subunit CasC
MVGGAPRLRISSQALKRAYRESAVFHTQLAGHLGERTQRLGEAVLLPHLLAQGVDAERAAAIVRQIIPAFGKPKDAKDKDPLQIEQLAFIAPEEKAAALALAERLASGAAEEVQPAALLGRADSAADIAMFGRMLAATPEFNREAAVQVSHAFTTHRAVVEDDFYTAVDDLKEDAEDAGAGFLGEQGFGSGLFYLYLCVDRPLLLKNLGGDATLAGAATAALAEAAAVVAPSGKVNAFAPAPRAAFLLAEKGDVQPRSLAAAFAKPVRAEAEAGVIADSIAALKDMRRRMDEAYGAPPTAAVEMDVEAGTGTLAEVVAFCRAP